MVKWNLEDIYRFKDTEKLISELNKEVSEFKKYRSRLNDSLSNKVFMKIVKKKESIMVKAHKLSSYAGLSLSENTSDGKRIAHESKISQICTEVGNEIMFFSLWFKSISDRKADYYIKNSGKYRYFLEVSRKYKPYTLNEKEEKIINYKDLSGADSLIGIYEIMTNGFTFKWKGKTITREELFTNVHSKYRRDRKEAYDLILNRYAENETVLSEIYKGIVTDWNNENVKIRGFKTPISVRNFGNELPDESVDALLKVVRKNSGLFMEYFELKSKILNVKMDRYDIYINYNDEKPDYPFEKCKKIVLEGYKEFDNEMYLNAKKIFDLNHVHSDIIKNKRGGAFCASVTQGVAPYVFLNHVGRLEDLFTMMHEFGHGVHNLLASKNTEFTCAAPLPLAETASTFGELLLSKKLIRNVSDEEKKAILIKQLDGFYATIIRQAYFVMFEIEAHKAFSKGATLDEVNLIYLNNLKEQFGKSIKIPDIFKHEWKYIPHIYFSPFYCYSYSFGNLLVLSLYKKYLEDGESFVPKYLKILSYGGSKAPADILKEVGFDITKESFWEGGFDVIREEIEELKKLV